MSGLHRSVASIALKGLVILVAVAGLAGCNKQRAEMAIKKADGNIRQARDWNAEKWTDSQGAFKAAQTALKSANDNIAGQQYAQALTAAQDAVKQSQEALRSAKSRFAEQRRTEANKAVKVAQINEGAKENPQLFEKAQKALTVAEEKFGKQKYEDTIAKATECINDIENLLARLKNVSENKLNELQSKLKGLDEVDANRYVPQAIIKAKEAAEQIKKKVEEDRDYKQAIIMAETAISDASAGITEAKKRRCQQDLGVLESKIAEAIAEEAPIFAPDALRTCQESFEEILRSFYDSQYDTVMAAAELLRPKVDQLITITRIEATKDKLKTVSDAISNLKEQQVEDHLPGRVKVMEDQLAKAQELFNNNDFDGAKEQAIAALVENDRIMANFDALAEKKIQDGDQAFAAAKQTFEKMVTFFSGTAPGSQRVVDARIDARREAEAANLNSRLNSALETLKLAQYNRGQKLFKKAIEEAKEVQATGDSVVNETFRLVAEHALLAISDELSELERQGAREQASLQLDQVKSLVDETQQLIGQKQNREAAERAAKTRAYLENVKQELARKAVIEKRRAEDLIKRIEGGGMGTPVSGGVRTPVERVSVGEFPGGSDLNNKEAMFDETVVIAQAAPPTGSIIGTRPEPVVPVTEQVPVNQSRIPYEAPTAPGPFAVRAAEPQTAGGAGAAGMTGGGVAGTKSDLERAFEEVNTVLSDDRRLLEIRRYQPDAVKQARDKLRESSEALQAQDYKRATKAALDAQSLIREAELKAAELSATENMKKASEHINAAEASGSIMFAPAQLSEAIGLYDQAKAFMEKGDYLMARDLSEKAMIAANDARLYNVNKARDMIGESTRYNGWRTAHPELAGAEQAAAQAEKLLGSPSTAAGGQEVAKQAVTLAQVALDKSRDSSFQDRIDNIYKALNTALHAGANYFNVVEVKRLIAEISEVRDEYRTRNYDAVEMKLKDIEAGLARVIETTPLVLEQNLVETTDKLNALVAAGAENYMAQEVDDVKTLMNRAVIDFRKRDFYSSYTNMKNAIAVADRIEARLQEQVYFDSVTELLAQLDKEFHNFDGILNNTSTFLKQLVIRPNGQPAAVQLAGSTNPNDFKDHVTAIYQRAIHLRPPKSQEGTHEQLLVAVKTAKVAGDNLQKLYILDQVSQRDAHDIIDTAFEQVRRAKQLRGDIQVRMIDPQARTRIIKADKIINY